MSILEKAKAHPYIAGGVLVGGLVIAYMVTSGGGAQQGGGGSYDSVQAGTALQQWQDQMTVQSAAIAADLTKTTGAQAAAIRALEIERAGQFDIAQLSAGLGYAQLEAAKEVSIAGTVAGEKAAQEETRRLQITSDTQTRMQDIMASVINNQTNSQTRVALDSHKPHGLFSFIFG